MCFMTQIKVGSGSRQLNLLNRSGLQMNEPLSLGPSARKRGEGKVVAIGAVTNALRSRASHSSEKKSGTRWNASLPEQ